MFMVMHIVGFASDVKLVALKGNSLQNPKLNP